MSFARSLLLTRSKVGYNVLCGGLQPRCNVVTSSAARSSEGEKGGRKVDYEIRAMRRSDVDGLYDLLAENGWNMERDYLQCVFDTDPSGLVVVVENDGKIIGHNGILSHSNCVASSGMNIVRDGYRELGIGRQLFRSVMDVMADSNATNNSMMILLQEGHNGILSHSDRVASSGMNIVRDGYRELGIGRQLFRSVMDVMADRNVGGTSLSNRISFYAQFGWTIPSFTLHYNQGPVNPDFVKNPSRVDGLEIEPITDHNFEQVLRYDAEIHTIPRPRYLRNWVLYERANSFVAMKNGKICGYSVLRPSDVGFKMYPLFADDKHIAHALFCRLASFVPKGQDIIFTQPIENEEATKFVTGNNLTNYLSMTRLYNKWNIDVDIKRVFCTSSTEYAIV